MTSHSKHHMSLPSDVQLSCTNTLRPHFMQGMLWTLSLISLSGATGRLSHALHSNITDGWRREEQSVDMREHQLEHISCSGVGKDHLPLAPPPYICCRSQPASVKGCPVHGDRWFPRTGAQTYRPRVKWKRCVHYKVDSDRWSIWNSPACMSYSGRWAWRLPAHRNPCTTHAASL